MSRGGSSQLMVIFCHSRARYPEDLRDTRRILKYTPSLVCAKDGSGSANPMLQTKVYHDDPISSGVIMEEHLAKFTV